MIRLMLAELDRLRSRRVLAIGLIVLLVALAGFQVAVGFAVRQPSAAAVAEARSSYEQAQRDYQENKDEIEQMLKECREEFPDQPEQCGFGEPRWDDFRPQPARYVDMAGIGVTIAVVFSGLAFLIIGASSIGAEYSSGAIGNWLTFVPDRLRVYASKLGVLVIAAAVIAAVATALTLLTAAILTKINSGPVTGIGKLVGSGGRGLMIVVVCAVAGFALALLSRHTIAALGVVLGYLVVDFVLAMVMGGVSALQAVKPWLVENNALAVLNNGYRYIDQGMRMTADGPTPIQIERHLSFEHGFLYLTALLVGAVLVSAIVFRRRDVA